MRFEWLVVAYIGSAFVWFFVSEVTTPPRWLEIVLAVFYLPLLLMILAIPVFMLIGVVGWIRQRFRDSDA